MVKGVDIVPGKEQGSLSGCPFCRCIRSRLPQVGTRFRILSGYGAGRMGTVVQSPSPPPLAPTEFLAQMDDALPDRQERIIQTDIFETFPLSATPEWAPPLSLRDTEELDYVIIKFCESGLDNGRWFINWKFYYEIIRHIWYKRLPINANELWLVLNAHGIPDQYKMELSEFFTKGRDLLVYSSGRRPIKKKRVKAFSII